MKIVLFALGVLAFAQGLDAAICVGPHCPNWRSNCEGTVEIKSELNGIEKSHGKLVKGEEQETPINIRKMKYNPRMERNSTKTIEVTGNCCWRFYQR